MAENIQYDSIFATGVPQHIRASISVEIISDVLLFGAYAAISVQLFIHSRVALQAIKSADTNGPVARGSLLFQLFVGACGVTHLGMGISNALMHTSAAMQAINMVLKLICACVSCYAAIVLTPTLKEAVEALGREHKRVIQMQERSEEAHIGSEQLRYIQDEIRHRADQVMASADIVQVLHAATSSLTKFSPYVEAAVVIPAVPRIRTSQSINGTMDKHSESSPPDDNEQSRSGHNASEDATHSGGLAKSAGLGLRYASISPRGSESGDDIRASMFLVAAHVQAGAFDDDDSRPAWPMKQSQERAAPNRMGRANSILPQKKEVGAGRIHTSEVHKREYHSPSSPGLQGMAKSLIIDTTAAGQIEGTVMQSVFGRIERPVSAAAQATLQRLVRRDEVVLVPPDLEARLLGQLVTAGSAGPLYAMRLAFPKRVTAALVGRGQKAVNDSNLYRAAEEAKRSTSTASESEDKVAKAADTVPIQPGAMRRMRKPRPTQLVLDHNISSFMQTILARVRGRQVAIHDQLSVEDDEDEESKGGSAILLAADKAPSSMTGLSADERLGSRGSDVKHPGVGTSSSQDSAMAIVLVRIRQSIHDRALAASEVLGMPRFMRSMLERVRAQLELSVLQSDSAVAERQFLKRTAKLERKRREASQTFLAMMSHELRTPLHAVLGYSELLQASETKLQDEDMEFLGTIKANGQQLLSLINDLLDLTKVDLGMLELEHRPLDIHSVAEDCVHIAAGRLQNKDRPLVAPYLHCIVDFDVPRSVFGDVARIRQILVNCLGNSAKFCETGHISLRVRRLSLEVLQEYLGIFGETREGRHSSDSGESLGGMHETSPLPLLHSAGRMAMACQAKSWNAEAASKFRRALHAMNKAPPPGQPLDATGMRRREASPLLLEISDSGIGIAPETADKLFQPFVQADTSTTRKYGGTGLGLPVVAKLIKIMKGALWLLARPGQGTTFLLAIPCVAAEPDASMAAGKVANRKRPKPPSFALGLGSTSGNTSRTSGKLSNRALSVSIRDKATQSTGAKAAVGLRLDLMDASLDSADHSSSSDAPDSGMVSSGLQGMGRSGKPFYHRCESLESIREEEEVPHAIVIAADKLTAAAYASTLSNAGATLMTTSRVSEQELEFNLRHLAAHGPGGFVRKGVPMVPHQAQLAPLLVQLQSIGARSKSASSVAQGKESSQISSLFVVVDARIALRDETEAFALQEIAARCRVVLVAPPGMSSVASAVGISRAMLEGIVSAPLRVERMTSILRRPQVSKVVDAPLQSAEGPARRGSHAQSDEAGHAMSETFLGQIEPPAESNKSRRRRVTKKKKKQKQENESVQNGSQADDTMGHGSLDPGLGLGLEGQIPGSVPEADAQSAAPSTGRSATTRNLSLEGPDDAPGAASRVSMLASFARKRSRYTMSSKSSSVEDLDYSTIRILVAEDNPVNMRLATTFLRRLGVQVVDKAEDGNVAIQRMQEREYDLCFMDIHMPHCDGIEAARRAQDPRVVPPEHLPRIVAMTASVQEQDVRDSRRAGMQGYITKPASVADFDGVLRPLVAARARNASGR